MESPHWVVEKDQDLMECGEGGDFYEVIRIRFINFLPFRIISILHEQSCKTCRPLIPTYNVVQIMTKFKCTLSFSICSLVFLSGCALLHFNIMVSGLQSRHHFTLGNFH